MADLAPTAANVQKSANGQQKTGVAGEAITAGEVIYKDTSDGNKLHLADADDLTKTDVAGIALNDAADDQPVTYCTEDVAFVVGATIAIGDVLVLSGTPGAIAPVADLAVGDETVVLGVGVSTTEMKMNFNSPNPLRAGAAKI